LILLHGAHELRGEQLGEVIGECDHLVSEHSCVLARFQVFRRAHRRMIDNVY
jgi:hypothetical protein